MEPLGQEINFSTEDMDTIDFAAVEPNVSSSSLLQMLQPDGTYTNGPVLDLHEYTTPLSPTMPLTELGDTVLPHDSATDAFDTATSLPVSVVVGHSVDSISMATAMNAEDASGLDVTPLLLSGLQNCELSSSLQQSTDITSECENVLNKELILENVPADLEQTVESCDDEIKGVIPTMTPGQINLPQFSNEARNLLPLSAPGPNVILASSSHTAPSIETCTTDVSDPKENSLKTRSTENLQFNNLLPIPSVSQSDISNTNLQGQVIRLEFNNISPDTTIVTLCFGTQTYAIIKPTNQNLMLNQEILTTLLNGSKNMEDTALAACIQRENVTCDDISVTNDKSDDKETCELEQKETCEDNTYVPLDDEDKPLQQLKDEMAYALDTGTEKDGINMTSPTHISAEIRTLEVSNIKQENRSCDGALEENSQNQEAPRENCCNVSNTGESEVEISSLMSDDIRVKMKTLAKLDEISIQINESQYQDIEGKGRWCCNKCDKSYKTKHNLIIHTLGHHGIKPHVCVICKRMFSQRSHLKTHILTHGNIRPHSCHICHRSFTQVSHVRRHISTHMEKRPYHCDECDRGFAYPSELKAHKIKHNREKNHKCEQCSAAFDDPKKLAFHVRTTHKDPSDLTCKKCGKEYTYPSQLRDHMFKHTGKRPYTCEECGMDFMKEIHLQYHMYTHSGKKPWVCSICSRTFNQKANMLRHMLIHEDQRKFECDICHKTFSQPQTLKAHRVIHSDKKPYNCRICGKEFGRLYTLQGHMHVHLDNRPHVCFCGAAFTLKGNLTRHKKVKHGLSDPSQCTEEEAAKILEIMSTKRRGPSSEIGTNNNSESCQDLGEAVDSNSEPRTGKGGGALENSEKNASDSTKDVDTLTYLKTDCNDRASLFVVDTTPIVENFHTYCAKDINAGESC